MGLMKDAPTATPRCIVELKDDYIHIVWQNRVTRELAATCNDQIYTAAQALIDQDKPVLALFSLVNAPTIPERGAFDELIKITRSGVSFRRIVICGKAPRLIRVLIDVFIHSYKSDFDVTYIADEERARKWLLDKEKTA
jgi:hypothetical protein